MCVCVRLECVCVCVCVCVSVCVCVCVCVCDSSECRVCLRAAYSVCKCVQCVVYSLWLHQRLMYRPETVMYSLHRSLSIQTVHYSKPIVFDATTDYNGIKDYIAK